MKIETQNGCEFFFGLCDSLKAMQQVTVEELTAEEQQITTDLIKRIENHLGSFAVRQSRVAS